MRQIDRGGFLPWALLTIPVLWLAALLASGYEESMTLIDLMAVFPGLIERPFAIRWTPYTPKFLLIGMAVYGCAAALYLSTRNNRRPGEEHGSARWGSVRQLNRKYRDKKPDNNVILTQHLQMGLDGRKHRRNLLQIIVGGSGAGKTRFVIKPNIYLANTSYLVTDPKGEVARAAVPLLLQKGYAIRVFDLVDPEHSDCYNPFRYIRKDADVFRLIDNFIKNTTPKNAHQSDPFWTKAETALLQAIILMLFQEAPEYEQNFSMVMRVLEYAEVREEDDEYLSPLDLLFQAMERENPESVALRQYKVFKQSAGDVCSK